MLWHASYAQAFRAPELLRSLSMVDANDPIAKEVCSLERINKLEIVNCAPGVRQARKYGSRQDRTVWRPAPPAIAADIENLE